MSLPDIKVNHHVSQPILLDEQAAKLKTTLLKDIQRSAYVYRVDCGGCNGCEIEIFSAITPLFDAERFGIKVVASPRHADILLFTGAVTRAMRVPALRAYESAPDPKICISYGACGCGGGIFHDLYCVWSGSESIVPIDVWIPGCPPTPAATLYGFAVALGLLDQKLKGEQHIEAIGEKAALILPEVPLATRVMIEREARRMGGYWQGRLISDEFLKRLHGASVSEVAPRLSQWLNEENDPRLREIVQRLAGLLQQGALPGGQHG
ncbi:MULTISPECIES: NADH-quinone oxidoreductase subunit B family protein [Enterobacteriaceae]|uniref:NiFe-hydrogenase 4 component I n=1 Tax=Atlantibacter hermannii NBRC 105704 TaxID=1115512 RepID=H5V2X1_ATLHE|nr:MULTISPECIES: NADH-quinone oxidoreductase subunit B family protein [Enterobacteriaceae]MCQ4969258.1 NADH-quinone oxidoreductase subunit B family protein [Enterobacteriaceae bacterium DFI.7.85]HAI51470.1 NADH-quinone oxidoreductase subunit NuoB [Enterobacteriaceae bacterium]KIU33987.1 hydrogenase [Atlantibacter hermannii]MBW9432621.1 NADH-quinone oxidoreductase subunit B family protein [Atlantibacter hermannii]MDQ7883125.1 NADH-quinone oxidoreductase subunit B family protein [Atlantibacter h